MSSEFLGLQFRMQAQVLITVICGSGLCSRHSCHPEGEISVLLHVGQGAPVNNDFDQHFSGLHAAGAMLLIPHYSYQLTDVSGP